MAGEVADADESGAESEKPLLVLETVVVALALRERSRKRVAGGEDTVPAWWRGGKEVRNAVGMVEVVRDGLRRLKKEMMAISQPVNKIECKTNPAGLETESAMQLELEAMALGSKAPGMRIWPMERLRFFPGRAKRALLLSLIVARRRRPPLV